jgi:hypothetical protein
MRRALRHSGLALVVSSVLMSGCAVGNRYAYSTVVLEPTLAGSGRVSVATQDRREYVLSGDKDPQFVGLQRGGYGNPFDVRTTDDRPLADNMTTAIVAAMAQRGFQPVPIFVAPSADAAQVRQALFKDGGERALLLTLREWKSDTFMNVGLPYDVTLVVMDKTGAVLAQKRLQGRDNLGGSFWDPPSHARKAVPLAFKAKLEELLNDPAIAGALR